jgi:magnesium-protoporphyrin IX monomethyl ester (oxidative) cyclase
VRDRARPEFHAALGLDPTEFDHTVFRITTEISRQVFPLTLPLDDPRFRAGLDRLRRIGEARAAAAASGGPLAGLKRAALGVAGALVFARLYLLPVRANALPQDVRLAPTW